VTGLAYTLGVVLFALGLLASIALHEVGHMLPAKKFGVKVSQYFVGFGRTLWSVKRGETEYGVKAIPLGGFVRLVGMFPPAKDQPEGTVRKSTTGLFTTLIADARAAEYESVTAADEGRLFYRKPWWQKLVIMTSGPMVNLILAVLILGGVFMGFGIYQPKTVIAQVSDCVIPATDAGRTCRPSDPVSPAKLAGLHSGDRIVSFNGQTITSWDRLTELIRANGNDAATLVYKRGGVYHAVQTSTTVTQRPDLNDYTKTVEVGFFGVSPVEVRERQGPGYVAGTMWDYTEKTAGVLVHMPAKMVGVFQAAFGGQARDAQSPMSVVGASRVAGELATTHQLSVSDRIASVLGLLGVVNLFVALFNFIPLLPLDGGHIAGALYEAGRRAIARLRGRPDPGFVDVAKLLPVAYVAATVIIVMGVLLVYADLVNPVRLSSG
jgi:membrane-associated protease RseP (regulator of RpoE activity)